MHKSILTRFQKNDPILYAMAKRVEVGMVDVPDNYFRDLVESIICQQLSEKAGSTIYNRFIQLFPSEHINPEQVLKIPHDTLRSVGISHSKADYIHNLARHILENNINFILLENLDDEAVIAELTKVKGIGRWTAEMFLVFSLGRDDVFSFGDVGLQRAIQKLYGLKNTPSKNELIVMSKRWAPYRSWASRILWKSLELK